MKLKDFMYNTTNGLASFTNVITQAINLFNQHSSIGSVRADAGFPFTLNNEDRLEYWDPHSININYGRYLVFDKSTEQSFDFWLGLDIMPGCIEFIIWFKKQTVSHALPILKSTFGANYHDPYCEVWISLDSSNFQVFDNNNKGTSAQQIQIIYNFLDSVLQLL
jgi:hypothetical protein